ncbi:MAG TPA: TraR/DksA C4-type zinc finger protein [Candidatus Nanopelagicales bacterium]|nr:TraR/DksA C4-type zinc finger protein [Candidatus Nanopelagicales bacterium]
MSVPTTTVPRTSELTDADLDRLRMSLAQLRCELDAQMRAASATLQELREEFSLTDPDVQAPLMTALHSLDVAERTSVDVVDALARIEGGTYGTCPRCRREIPLARLEVRPAGRFCLDCSR